MPEEPPKGKGLIVVSTALAAPVALAFERFLHWALLPPEFAQIQARLAPWPTTVAWVLCAVAVAAGLAGLIWQKRLTIRALDRVPAAHRTPERLERARIGAFFLAASIPQVPAILATIAHMFGASLLPVIVAIVICTVVVCIKAVQLVRAAHG